MIKDINLRTVSRYDKQFVLLHFSGVMYYVEMLQKHVELKREVHYLLNNTEVAG